MGFRDNLNNFADLVLDLIVIRTQENEFVNKRKLLQMSASPDDMTQYDWFSQARIYESIGNDEKALKAYEESISLDPKYAKAWFHKAKLHYKLKQMDLARKCAKRVLELEPDWESYIKKYMPNL